MTCHMSLRLRARERGVGLIEVMVSIVIAMLLVLVIYQIYEVSEGQKRTITAGSDAQQNAAFGLYILSRDVSVAGNGIAAAAGALDQCALLRPIPVLIKAGASDNDEAEFIIEEVKALNRSGTALVDMALLYRSNAQSRVLEHALFRAGVAYRSAP